MKYYLSSFKIGDDPTRLKDLLPKNKKAVYISNALDRYNDNGKSPKFRTRFLDFAVSGLDGFRRRRQPSFSVPVSA